MLLSKDQRLEQGTGFPSVHSSCSQACLSLHASHILTIFVCRSKVTRQGYWQFALDDIKVPGAGGGLCGGVPGHR